MYKKITTLLLIILIMSITTFDLGDIFNKKFSILLFAVLILFIITLDLWISNTKIRRETEYIKNLASYSYKKFYSLKRKNLLNLDLELQKLNHLPLSVEEKKRLTKICSFYIDDGMERILVAKGYDGLLRLYSGNSSTLIEKYKALKDGSRGLEVLYTQTAALNLAKLIISGYEEQINALLNHDGLELLEYFTGYSKDEIPFLEKLTALNIPELTARSLYRVSLINIFGRSSFNEKIINSNYAKAVEEIQNVIKITGIKQDNELDIALTINDEFAEHAAVVISSSLLNADLNSFYKFHVIMNPHDQLSEESKIKLSSMQYIKNYSIDFINFPEEVIKEALITKLKFYNVDLIRAILKFCNENLIRRILRYYKKWPRLTIYRLYLDKIFPNLDSMLYLDSDIVVLHDLTALKNIDMTNYIAAAAVDSPLINCTKYPNNSNCNYNITYNNSGVIFFNLKNMTHYKTSDLLSTTLKNSNDDFKFPDQDLFNLSFHNYLYPLSRGWNYFTTSSKDNFMGFSYYIAHYAGSHKPWTNKEKELWQTNPDKLSEDIKNYWRYKNLTPF